MLLALRAWILSLMIYLQPHAAWRATYEASATAFAKVAVEQPLFTGAHAAERTAVLFVATAFFESNFNNHAKGDHGQSVCEFQVGVSNLKALGMTEAELTSDEEKCTRAARAMMKGSFDVCRGRPVEEKLAHYAAGGDGCPTLDSNKDAVTKSFHRVKKAEWLFAHRPMPVVRDPATEGGT